MAINRDDLTKADKSAYWRKHVSAWAASGTTQAEYCRCNNLKVRNFGYWKRRFQQSSDQFAFAPLPISPSQADAPPLRLLLKDGIRLEVESGFSRATLLEILQTLRQL